MSSPLLLITVLIIATCGLIYELLAGTVASYVLGDSVTQFSTVIGVYLSAMGLGAHLSKYLDRQLARRFVEIELLVALVGGLSAPLLFFSFAHVSFFRVVLYGTVTLVGTLVGLEIPLLLRILQDRYAFKDLIARVLTFDYMGALLASLLFPMFLVPKLGLVRTSLLFGLINAVVAMWTTHLMKPLLQASLTTLRTKAALTIALMVAGLIGADRLTLLAEEGTFADEVVFASTSPYQRLVVTRGRSGFQLFINGNLQFASADEYRYHESLVHPAMSVRPDAKRVLVMGGGDGLAVREILKYPSVEKIVLVDLDPGMTQLARTNPLLRELNHDALSSPRVEVINDDAYVWLTREGDEGPARFGAFDVAIVDFPDPNNFSLGKLYTTRFYALARKALAPGAPIVVQSTSPLMARTSFWCVVRTMEQAGLYARPYHVTVPSFGEWGYVLASDRPFDIPTRLHAGPLRFLTDEMMPTTFVFPADMGPVPVEVNRLNNQILVQYYEEEWKRWN